MPIFKGQPQIRVITQPIGNRLLSDFSTGSGTHEEEVNLLVQRQFDGSRKFRTTVVAAVNELERPIGVCGYRPRLVSFAALPVPTDRAIKVTAPEFSVPDAGYIHMIGISEGFRGWKLEDGTRMGTFVLRATVNQIAKECGRMPVTWAYVAQDNRASHRMFATVDFGLIERDNETAETVRYRPAGLEVYRTLSTLVA
jgi:hypothetical protein